MTEKTNNVPPEDSSFRPGDGWNSKTGYLNDPYCPVNVAPVVLRNLADTQWGQLAKEVITRAKDSTFVKQIDLDFGDLNIEYPRD